MSGKPMKQVGPDEWRLVCPICNSFAVLVNRDMTVTGTQGVYEQDEDGTIRPMRPERWVRGVLP